MPSSRGSSQPGDQTWSLMSPALAGRFFTTSATWEAPFLLQGTSNSGPLIQVIIKTLSSGKEFWNGGTDPAESRSQGRASTASLHLAVEAHWLRTEPMVRQLYT